MDLGTPQLNCELDMGWFSGSTMTTNQSRVSVRQFTPPQAGERGCLDICRPLDNLSEKTSL